MLGTSTCPREPGGPQHVIQGFEIIFTGSANASTSKARFEQLMFTRINHFQ